MVQNAAVGAATYAITTGGRVVGDVVIGAGDLIEGAGRHVGNNVEGYIDRYGNWVRSYGDGAIAATASSSPAYTTKPKALPSSKTPKGLLPAPPKKKDKNKNKRPGLAKKSLSDSKTPLPLSSAKALPSAGVKKALPAATGAAQGLSKGQLAKTRGIKAEDLKNKVAAPKSAAGAVGGAGVDGVKKGVTGLGAGVGKIGGGVAGAARKPAAKANNSNNNYATSDVSSSTTTTKKEGPVTGTPSPRTPAGGGAGGKVNAAAGGQQQAYPKPFSTKRPDGKVVVSKESRPGFGGGATAAKTSGAGKKDEKKGGYDFSKPEKKEGGGGGGGGGGGVGGKGKNEKGGFDFMRLMAEDPKKKGPGSVAGSAKTNATARKSAPVGGGGGKQETTGKYDFF